MNFQFGIKEIKARRIGANDPVVLCLCKNEEYYLDSFLEHYRTLGFRHFVFLDNGSTDGTVQKLATAEDVTLLTSKWPFKHHQDDFKRSLISVFGRNRWSLTVDADEFLDLPQVPPMSLDDFLAYLDFSKFNAVFTPMLDMFCADILPAAVSSDVKKFDVANYPLCSVNMVRKPFLNDKILARFNRGFLRYRGGIREQLFGVRCALHKFALTKHTDGDPLYRTPHNIFEKRSHVADVSGVLQHYKYTAQFRNKVEVALRDGQFFNNSAEYKKYDELLSNKDLILPDIRSLKYVGPEKLCSNGFGFMSDAYINFSDSQCRT